MRELLLKASATVMTMAATISAAVYVGGHVKNAGAPLHPPVVGATAASPAAGGQLSLTPSVQTGDVQPVTSTYAS
jgi:hypothetical protein